MPAFLADSIKEYVRLIEGQMNNDELFCYFINQLDYYENHPNEEKELQWYFQYLIDMSFFKEICKDTYKYHNMVRRAVLIFMINGGQHRNPHNWSCDKEIVPNSCLANILHAFYPLWEYSKNQ